MIVIDATVLTNFVVSDEMFLLDEFCGDQGILTREVVEGFHQGVKKGLWKTANVEKWEQVERESFQEEVLYQHLSRSLGVGEASSLAIAVERKHDLLSDDQLVRDIAHRCGIRVSGSLGVLIEAMGRKKITYQAGNWMLHDLLEHGFQAPINKLEELKI